MGHSTNRVTEGPDVKYAAGRKLLRADRFMRPIASATLGFTRLIIMHATLNTRIRLIARCVLISTLVTVLAGCSPGSSIAARA
jgi:hypothetical protein